MIAYTSYPSDPRVRREAETMAALKEYNVSFIVPMENSSPREYIMDGVNVMELNMKRYQGKNKARYLLSYLNYSVRAFWAITILFFMGKTDVVHVHNMPDFLVFAAVIPRIFGKKIILDVHDSMPETYGSKFSKNSTYLFRLMCLEEYICSLFVHKIICVNHVQRDLLVERGIPSHKIDVSMNVPDHKRFNGNLGDKNISILSSNFKLVYHGTLVKRLGIDLTIKAVAKLTGNIPNLEFNIIGAGDDSEEFMALTKNMGLEKHVHFSGLVPVERVASALRGMNVGVVSNRKDVATEFMLPVKMLEYIALDIPVVVPRLRTIQYYFSDDMVSYFEPENIDSLADAISGLYYDESKRVKQAQNAIKFIEKYGWEKHSMDFIQLYKEL